MGTRARRPWPRGKRSDNNAAGLISGCWKERANLLPQIGRLADGVNEKAGWGGDRKTEQFSVAAAPCRVSFKCFASFLEKGARFPYTQERLESFSRRGFKDCHCPALNRLLQLGTDFTGIFSGHVHPGCWLDILSNYNFPHLAPFTTLAVAAGNYSSSTICMGSPGLRSSHLPCLEFYKKTLKLL